MDLACLLIADDLTGACDAAAPFAIHGHCVRVVVSPEGPLAEADVVAISTESRDAGTDFYRRAIEGWKRLRPRILFKKIDSTLRGHVGLEVSETLRAFGCDAALVTPAFPAMGRLVKGGYLRVDGEVNFLPREVAGCFENLNGIELCDAICDAHLDQIVAGGLLRTERISWVGSAGLAQALARATTCGPCPARTPSVSRHPIFCLGSDHPVTMKQQDQLLRLRRGALFTAESATPDSLRGALADGPVVLRIQRGGTSVECIRELLSGADSPLVLCGGDTASLVCRALDVQAIDLKGEIAAGIPWGLLAGGSLDGIPVVTKSGGFGGPDALMQVADYFICSRQSH